MKLCILATALHLSLAAVSFAQPAQAEIPQHVLEKAKEDQKEELRVLKQTYERWLAEVKRLERYPNKKHQLEEARTRCNKAAAEAKVVASEEGLKKFIGPHMEVHNRSVSLANGQQAVTENYARMKAEAEARARADAEAKMQAAAAAAAIAEEQRQLAIAARQQQEARDRATWGYITEEKFDRIEEDMSLYDVEKIMGPGTLTKTIAVEDETGKRYEWQSKTGRCNLTVITINGRVFSRETDGILDDVEVPHMQTVEIKSSSY